MRVLYDCESCGQYHPYNFHGSCRDDDGITEPEIADFILPDVWDIDAFEEYANWVGSPVDAYETFDEAFHGHWYSKEDFAESILDEFGYLDNIPSFIVVHFDYKSFAQDLFVVDYFMTESGFVFRYI